MEQVRKNFEKEYHYIVYYRGKKVSDYEPLARFNDKKMALLYCNSMIGKPKNAGNYMVFDSMTGHRVTTE